MPVRKGRSFNAHTVDERVDMESHLEIVSFYYNLIRNLDVSKAASTGEIQEIQEEVGEL